MIITSIQNIGKVYGGRSVFENLTWEIDDKARIGLVGPNGAGKSTLLKIVASLEDVTSGTVTWRRGLRVAYLPQHIAGNEHTPMQTVLAARTDLAQLEAEIAACEAALNSPAVLNDLDQMSEVLERQAKLLERFEAVGGPMVQNEARGHLVALGLEAEAFELPTNVLSGGQRKLIALAACLIQRPDLLLLDEPETHLDLARRGMLEALVREFSGAIVIISHDRYLLDETVTQIVQLEDGRVSTWLGNYSAYAVNRELMLQKQAQDFAAQQQEIARLEEAIKRFNLWASVFQNERSARQARVKQMQIDKMDKVEKPVLERRKLGLALRSAVRGGQKIVELRDVSMAFDADLVLLGVEQTIWRGERIGIIGANGAGKSVLGRLMMGLIEPTEGLVWRGPSISIGYFAQGVENLDHSATPIEVVRLTRSMYENQAIGFLDGFLFTYEQCRQPISTMSGGERARLQLALLMLDRPNCLILDEPTNHLDIAAAEVLENALDRYDGTVIVISHDRYFLDRVVDRVLVVTDGAVDSFSGGYSEWHEHRAALKRQQAEAAAERKRLQLEQQKKQAEASRKQQKAASNKR
ncbi:MAG: ATP-binding cassette domain-containing protein [Herpetosiphonaceae bacterium]|nr:ATP-binding cassette domain-containing protein [Herpetosiphonaceae bacterium]